MDIAPPHPYPCRECAYGHQKRARDRAAIAQFDVLQRQRPPHPSPVPARGEVAPRENGPARSSGPSNRGLLLYLGTSNECHFAPPRYSIGRLGPPLYVGAGERRTGSTITSLHPSLQTRSLRAWPYNSWLWTMSSRAGPKYRGFRVVCL